MEPPKHLLVDGSNILHAWPELKGLLRRNREAARSRLSQLLSVLHDAEGLRVSIVFDGRGAELVVERPSGQSGFSHLFTPSGVTADDVIEKMVSQSKRPAELLVATDDRAERSLAEAAGASVLSSADLAAWVGGAASRQRERLETNRRANRRKWEGPEG